MAGKFLMEKVLAGLGATNLVLAACIKDVACVWVGVGCLGLALGGYLLEKAGCR